MSGAFQLTKGTLETIVPVYDTLVVRMIAQGDQVSESTTIIRPDVAKMENFFGRVVEVGPGRPLYAESEIVGDELKVHHAKMPVEIGDDILFRRYHGERMDFGGHLFLALKEVDIVLKLDLTESLEKGFIVWASPDDKALGGALEASRVLGKS